MGNNEVHVSSDDVRAAQAEFEMMCETDKGFCRYVEGLMLIGSVFKPREPGPDSFLVKFNRSGYGCRCKIADAGAESAGGIRSYIDTYKGKP